MKPELEDLLKHYGVKGMKWDESKRKKNSELMEDFRAKLENARNSTSDLADGLGNKLSTLDDKFKKLGAKILTKIFGKGGKKTTVISSNFEGKVGKYTVSHPYNKDGSLKTKTNKKTTILTDKTEKLGSLKRNRKLENDIRKASDQAKRQERQGKKPTGKFDKISKNTSSFHMDTIKSPSEASIKAVARMEAEKYKRDNYTKGQLLVDRIKNRGK